MNIPDAGKLMQSGFLMALSALLTTASSFSQDLIIERPELVPKPNITKEGWEKLGDDLFRYDYFVPLDRLVPDVVDDPFSGEPAKTAARVDAQGILEQAGVPFPDGTSATFIPAASVVRAINTRANMELLNVYFSPRPDPPKRIAVRTEIYELTQLQVLQLLESGAAESDHTPERNAALKFVRDGHAKLVATQSISAIPGQRAKVDDSTEVQVAYKLKHPSQVDEEEGSAPADPQPESIIEFDTRSYGSILEVEPNIAADQVTISMNISIEHHTADPEMDVIVDGIRSPRFHAKKILTHCTVLDGECLMLGTWKPTGKPEYAKSDLTHLVFVTAIVQEVSDPVHLKEKPE